MILNEEESIQRNGRTIVMARTDMKAVTDVESLRVGYFYKGAGTVVTEAPEFPLIDLSAIYKEFSAKIKQSAHDSEKLLEISREFLARPYEQYSPHVVKSMLNRLLMDVAIATDYDVNAGLPQINGFLFCLCQKKFEDSIRIMAESVIRISHDGISKAIEYIDMHLYEEMSCEGVALYVNMNSSYFSRLFKREMRVSFSSYIMNKRMQAATYMLMHSNCPIDEITSAIGIESVSYFYRAYKRITGNTPGDVRNKVKRDRIKDAGKAE